MSTIRTLSLKCPCGYIKHDVIHIGVYKDRENSLVKFCGGLFLIDSTKDVVTCRKCLTENSSIEFHCSFCDRKTVISVQERVQKSQGKVTVMQLSVHKTVVFSS